MTMNNKQTTIAIAAVAAAVAITITVVVATVYSTETERTAQAQLAVPSSNQNTVNFTKLFEQNPGAYKISGYVTILYQSPKTVVLEAEALRSFGAGYVDNELLWQGVDIVKNYGYKVDSVVPTGLGTVSNPTVFYVVMLHP